MYSVKFMNLKAYSEMHIVKYILFSFSKTLYLKMHTQYEFHHYVYCVLHEYHIAPNAYNVFQTIVTLNYGEEY